MIFYQHYRKDYVNPYRTGVKIGNYNEDLFGTELQQKYKSMKLDPRMYISEHHDKYTNPETRPRTAVQKPIVLNPMVKGNGELDLNLNMDNEIYENYMKLKQRNILNHENTDYGIEPEKNKPDQGNFPENYHINKQRAKSSYGPRVQNLNNQNMYQSYTQPNNQNYNQMYNPNIKVNATYQGNREDLKYNFGMDNNMMGNMQGDQGMQRVAPKRDIIFGNGRAAKGNYVTMNQLAYGEKERTDEFLHPKYKIKKDFKKDPYMVYDQTDWNFRKFRKGNDFSGTFDMVKLIGRGDEV